MTEFEQIYAFFVNLCRNRPLRVFQQIVTQLFKQMGGGDLLFLTMLKKTCSTRLGGLPIKMIFYLMFFIGGFLLYAFHWLIFLVGDIFFID